MRAWLTRRVTEEGSTRTAALIRIGLPLLIWARLGNSHLFFRGQEWWSPLISASFFLSTTAMLVGWRSRLSSAWTGTTLLFMYYFMGQYLGSEAYNHHHVYLLIVAPCLLACTECGRSWSIDRWRVVRAARAAGERIPAEVGPTWGLWLITLQLSQIYLWAMVAKCNAAFLSGARLEQILMYLYFGSDYPAIPGFHGMIVVLAYLTVAIELVLAVGLFIRRTHHWLLPMGVALHAVMYVALPVSTFSATMWLLYLAVLDPDRVHALIDQMSGGSGEGADPAYAVRHPQE